MATDISPPIQDVYLDRDNDDTITITLPAGAYLTGGASGWGLSCIFSHEVSEAAVITKTNGAGITVTQAGSASQAAIFVVAIADTDTVSLSKRVRYPGIFKRTDAGSEVDIARPRLNFKA